MRSGGQVLRAGPPYLPLECNTPLESWLKGDEWGKIYHAIKKFVASAFFAG